MGDGYLGNSHLKKVDQEIEWTPELIKEYIKCSKDPVYFAKTYIKIVHVDRGLIPFEMYDYQKDIVQKISDNRRCAVLTARQSGKTTTAVAVILHYILFNEFATVAILANKGDAAREVLARIKLAYEALPKWLQQGITEWNKGNIELENGCKVLAGTTTSSAIRGESTKLLMTSTPNGLNHFWKTCKGAEEGTNGYQFVKVMWHDVPGRGEAWKKETLESLDHDEDKFNQEYCCEFLGSSGTLISGSKLKELYPDRPILTSEGLIQYEKPIKNEQYVITADVARGKGLDYSTFTVFNITEMPYRQVAVFRDNHIGPIDFASVLNRIGMVYNTAGLLVEINDIGGQVVDVLHIDYGYENLLYTQNSGRTGKVLSGGFGKNVENGIRTTKLVKGTGCSMLKMLVEQNQLLIRDYDTIQELSRFSKKANSFEAEPGFHDDLVMNLVLFSWMTEQAYFKDMTDINTLIKLREKTDEQIEEEMLPFGFIDDGDVFYEDDGLVL
jgi:hypothetical protein